jgi:two-component system, OmpR family, sensor histidine kinase ChvG
VRTAFLSSIRARLFFASLALLAIPWLAAHSIARMEAFLRDSQSEAIAGTARAVASALSDRAQLFPAAGAPADDPETMERRRIVALFAGADPDAAASLGAAYAPSEEIERFLDIMARSASRVWVVDTRSRVRGLSGNLRETKGRAAKREEGARSFAAALVKPLVGLIVRAPDVPAGDESTPVRAQIDQALIGVSSTQWRGTKDREVAILAAAQPIFIGDNIVGAVVVEETTGSIQLLKQSALEDLIAVTLLVSAGVFAALLFFASRLAVRIRRLHREAEGAIDSQGRIRGSISRTDARDEIGDLARTMAAVLGRLKEYNAYLEQVAGRLSHELRTPVAVVRSSLDNLRAQTLDAGARVYLDRAGEGVDRLSRLISRLSEGTRLERMLESTERERFDLAALVAGCVEGYRAAYPGQRFDLASVAAPVWLEGVPDAVAQLLDKLVENAIDFAPPDSAIRIELETEGTHARLAVENAGPPLPEAMLPKLFDSMVSVREEGARREGHLGLGLYIVRLVAEYHGGRVRASNLPDGGGVRFEVALG